MATAYEGNEPYIFISYSHKNSHIVIPIIESLQSNGFRVWFDGGIEAGSEWPEYIATHLKASACVLTFISENFVRSKNCRRELNFAQDLEKPLLNIYIDDVKLTDGMKMQLGLNQALFKKNFKNEHDFHQAIFRAKLIQNCLNIVVHNEKVKEQVPSVTQTNIVEQPQPTADERVVTQYPKRKAVLNWSAFGVQFSYAVIGPLTMHLVTQNFTHAGLLILLTACPLVLLTIITLILYKTIGKKLESQVLDKISTATAGAWFFSIIISLIACPFFVHTTENVFLKIIIPIGLHIIPALISMVVLGLGLDYTKKS